jgi:hypothetical protein
MKQHLHVVGNQVTAWSDDDNGAIFDINIIVEACNLLPTNQINRNDANEQHQATDDMPTPPQHKRKRKEETSKERPLMVVLYCWLLMKVDDVRDAMLRARRVCVR